MNGAHDLGGMHGMGPVQPDDGDPVFAADWERSIFGVATAVLGQGLMTNDDLRYGIERMAPAEYLTTPYYQHWLHSIEQHLVYRGVISRNELEAKLEELERYPTRPVPRRHDPALTAQLYALVEEGGSPQRDTTRKPRFDVGDVVGTRNMHPAGHTRLPRYARDKVGTVVSVRDSFVYPDSNAAGAGENPQHVYTVRFDAETLWGTSAEQGSHVYLDLWEDYLAAAVAKGPHE